MKAMMDLDSPFQYGWQRSHRRVGGLLRDGGPALLATLAVGSVGIQLLFYIPAFLRKTETFYDLIGASTYLVLVWSAVSLTAANHSLSPVQWGLVAAVSIWAVRLGSYLAIRVHQHGKDSRFDAIKNSPTKFLVAWSLQGFWCFVVSSPVLLWFPKTPTP